ncbi:ferrochelatase [Psittacicella hinzii]|nr:ferrochelatase [Psittacicella hinzii]
MAKISVILANLGTPEAPTSKEVSSFLGEFLSDPRVVDVPQPKWGIILRFIRLFRSPKVAKTYAQVWTEQGSPLMAISGQQRDALQVLLTKLYPQHQWTVALGMTYGQPNLKLVVPEVFAHQPDHVILLPAYPQFSSTTTLPVIDQFNRGYADKNQRFMPSFSVVRDYHLHQSYIQALAQSIKQHVAKLLQQDPKQVDVSKYFSASNKLFISYHGIPTRFAEQLKDPYPELCEQTTAALVQTLGLKPEQYQQTYQSVFGKEPWLVPQTDQSLEAHAKTHPNAQVVVICPGFSADCIETIEEIGQENHEVFMHAGGKAYSWVECLNADPTHIQALVDILAPHIKLVEETFASRVQIK